MYNVAFAIDSKEDLQKAILSKVTEYEVYSHYLGHAFQIGVIFLSPFRKERRPSFGVYKTPFYHGLLHKDFGDARYSGDCFSLVEQLHAGYTRKDAIHRVWADLAKGKLNSSLKYMDTKPTENTTKVRRLLQYEPKYSLTDLERTYWDDIGITEEWRKFFNIYPVYRLLLDGIETWLSTAENPVFIYKIFDKIKAYRPFEKNKSYKWLSNTTRFDIQGWEQLPEFNDESTIIITKSLKDVAVLRTLGYLAIAPSSEAVMIPRTAMKLLADKYGIKRFIILYDRDHGGMTGTKKMFTAYRGTYNITFKFLGKGHPKDISDFRREYGERVTKRYLKYLIGYEPNEKLRVLSANGTQTAA
jgi:hypothetical protein